MAPIPATGYWMFMCNPAKWAVDDFLEKHNTPRDTYSVSEARKDQFKPGQLGLICVGLDRRNRDQLQGRSRLEPGVYAIVEVLSEAFPRRDADADKYWYEKPDKRGPVVEIQYLRNLLHKPVLLDMLKVVPDVDPKLIRGLQESSFPIQKYTFELVAQLAGLDQAFWSSCQ